MMPPAVDRNPPPRGRGDEPPGFGAGARAAASPWLPAAGAARGPADLASLGIFPVSVALAALVVHSSGPAPFFPLAGATLAAAILAGLSQQAWRSFGLSNAGANQCPAATQSPAAEDGTAGHPDRP